MSRHGDRQRVARYVVARRRALDITQEQLAERARVDPKTVGSLESATRWPQKASREKIEQALDWDEGDLARIAEGGFPVSGPLPDDDPEGVIAAAGTSDFDTKARAVIASLPEPQRSVVEEIYLSLLDAKRQNERLFSTLLAIPQRSEDGTDDTDDDGGATTGPHAVQRGS
ncbi:helix-turn-helix domain-containing protein [Actinomadura rudentiformis]|nr:helix-turn-helix transcriptional regulator [Actinomadura rudentiformis]